MRLAVATTSGGPLSVAQVAPAELVLQSVQEKKALIGPSRKEETRQALTPPVDGRDHRAQARRPRRGPVPGDLARAAPPVRPPRPVEPGAGRDDRRHDGPRRSSASWASSSATAPSWPAIRPGEVSSWQVVQPPRAGAGLTRIHRFTPHAAPVVGFAASRRDKGFVTADAKGSLHVSFGTSGRTLLSLDTPGGDPIQAVAFAPKADGLLTLDGSGPAPELEARQPPSGDHARHAVREGLVRRVPGARVRLAVHRRHRRLRVEVQPDARSSTARSRARSTRSCSRCRWPSWRRST